MKKIILFIALIVTLSGCSSRLERRFIKEVSAFSDWNKIDWDVAIDYLTFYEWNNEGCNQFYAMTSNVDLEREAYFDYINLNSARKAFHHKLQSVRTIVSVGTLEAIDKTEAKFDTVWMKYLRQDYHVNLMEETYNQVMGPAINELINELTNK